MSIKTSHLLAIGLAAGVIGWVWSGETIKGGQTENRPATIAERNTQEQNKLFRVQASIFDAQQHVSKIEVRGSTEASSKVSVRSETVGLLESRHVKKGQHVSAGDLICSLKIGAREALMQQREAELRKVELDYEAALKLVQNGYATKARVNGNRAELDAARAAMKTAKIEMERVLIRAPIDGIIQDPFSQIGDMLQVGDVCANVMQPDTMKMIAQVSERFIDRIKVGDKASVNTATGETVEGNIVYIAPSADINTRTFRIEIALPNDEHRIRDGVTAIAKIDTPGVKAHHIPASVLTLNDKGILGVRTVNAEGEVRFLTVDIIDDTRNGMWISGLPDKIKIITRGQEYVVNGQKVNAVIKTAKASQ